MFGEEKAKTDIFCIRTEHMEISIVFVSFDLVKSNLGKNVEWLRDKHTICQLLGFGGYQERRKKTHTLSLPLYNEISLELKLDEHTVHVLVFRTFLI